MKQKNIIAGVVLLAVSLGYGWLALQLPDRVQTGALPPSFFPMIIAGLLILFSGMLLYQGLFVTPLGAQQTRPQGLGKAGIFLAVFFLYILALGIVGFVFASIPFFAFLMVMFGERRLPVIVFGALGVPLFLHAIFEQGLYLSYVLGDDWRFSVPLPKGTWVEF